MLVRDCWASSLLVPVLRPTGSGNIYVGSARGPVLARIGLLHLHFVPVPAPPPTTLSSPWKVKEEVRVGRRERSG